MMNKVVIHAEGHPGWQRSWVPFLDDDESDYLCLDAGQPGCPVRECWSGQPDHPTVAPSLQAWAEQFVTGLEVRARVRCGNHAVGYAFGHGVWEWFYEKVIFFF